jgi:hypothetical protein
MVFQKLNFFSNEYIKSIDKNIIKLDEARQNLKQSNIKKFILPKT